MGIDRVKNYYDNQVEHEWIRLDQDYYHKIEFEVTKHFIYKYTSPNSRIIDIGGGPGRYTIDLLENNHCVCLVDLSPQLLDKAKSEIDKRNLSQLLENIFERNATNLAQIKSNTYDPTLLMGPLYHLTEYTDRKLALLEALRVTRPGGYIFSSIIPKLCPVRDMFRWSLEGARQSINNENHELDRILNTCTYLNESNNPNAFTDASFANTFDMPNLYKELNIELVESFSCEGIAAFQGDKINALVNNETTWKNLLQIIIRTATEPSALGAGEHCVFVGRKKKI